MYFRLERGFADNLRRSEQTKGLSKVQIVALIALSATVIGLPIALGIYFMSRKVTDETHTFKPQAPARDNQTAVNVQASKPESSKPQAPARDNQTAVNVQASKPESSKPQAPARDSQTAVNVQASKPESSKPQAPACDNQTAVNNAELHRKIKRVIGKTFTDEMMNEIEDYAKNSLGKTLPKRKEIKDFRLKKKFAKRRVVVTPLASDRKTIDGFLLHGKKLGKGAFSTVKKGIYARHEQGQWRVKVVAMHKGQKKGRYNSKIRDQIFKRENNEKLKKLKIGIYKTEIEQHRLLFGTKAHPNIENSPLSYGWLDDKREFMLHELRRGDLEHIPAKSSQHLLMIAKDIAEGLAFYHDNGVLFCDLKPANILMDKKGQAILSDPMEVKEGEVQGGFAGTPMYFPPESVSPKGKQNRACDVYTLGATLLDLKRFYLENVVEKLQVSTAEKESLMQQITRTFPTTYEVAHQPYMEKLSLPEVILLIHSQRILDLSSKDKPQKIIQRIYDSGGFKEEGIVNVKANLEYLDTIAKNLLATRPQMRLTARQVANLLDNGSTKALTRFQERYKIG